MNVVKYYSGRFTHDLMKVLASLLQSLGLMIVVITIKLLGVAHLQADLSPRDF